MHAQFQNKFVNLYYFCKKMINLYRTNPKSQDSKKQVSANSGKMIKNFKIGNRNYSNSHLKSAILNQIKVEQQCKQVQGKISDPAKQSCQNLQKYSINRIKQLNSGNRIVNLRKNSSLKIFKSDSSIKIYDDKREDFNRFKLSQKGNAPVFSQNCIKQANQSSKNRTISIKRRVELLKKNHNSLKIKDINNSTLNQSKIRSQDFIAEANKTIQFKTVSIDKQIVPKIRSENCLGEGLRRSGSSKIKILVKNPFQKRMRLEEEFKQSQIISKMNESIASIENKCELQQILAMI